MLKKKFLPSAVFAAILAMTSGTASAVVPVIDAAVVQAITALNTGLTSAVQAGNNILSNILTAVNHNTGTAAANANLAQSVEQQQADQARNTQFEVARLQKADQLLDKYQLPSDPCTTGEVADVVDSVTLGAANAMGRFGGGGGGARAPIGNPAVKAAVKEIAPANSPPREISNARTAKQHVDGGLYCTQDEVTGAGTGLYCQAEGALPNADVDPETLFRGAGATKTGNVTRTFNAKQMDAVHAYLRNIGGGSPLGPALTAKQARSAFGPQYYGLQKELEQLVLLAKEPMAESVALSTPQKITKNLMDTILASAPGAKDFYKKRAAAAGGYPDGMSWMDLMDIDVARRYSNGDWYTEMAKATPEAVTKETMFIQAQANYLAMENLKKQEKIGIILGAMLASQSRQEYTGKLEAKRAEMQRAGY